MRTRAGLYGGRHLYDRVVVASNIPEMIVMIRHILVIDLRAVLRPILITGTLADAAPAAPTRVKVACLLLVAAVVMWLAATGVGTGAEWDMYPGEGTSSQDAIDGAGAIEL